MHVEENIYVRMITYGFFIGKWVIELSISELKESIKDLYQRWYRNTQLYWTKSLFDK